MKYSAMHSALQLQTQMGRCRFMLGSLAKCCNEEGRTGVVLQCVQPKIAILIAIRGWRRSTRGADPMPLLEVQWLCAHRCAASIVSVLQCCPRASPLGARHCLQVESCIFDVLRLHRGSFQHRFGASETHMSPLGRTARDACFKALPFPDSMRHAIMQRTSAAGLCARCKAVLKACERLEQECDSTGSHADQRGTPCCWSRACIRKRQSRQKVL